MASLVPWLLLVIGSCPCLFDRDQLAGELAARPGVREAIFGIYPVHGAAWYRARIAALGDPETLSPAQTDDLAVARLQLGEPAEAVRLLVAKEARWPGLFTTAANLAQAAARAGDLAGAVAAAEQAVARVEGDPSGQQLVLTALRQLLLATTDPAAAADQNLFGVDPAERLGAGFRLAPPIEPDEAWRESVDRQLGLAPDRLDLLLDLLRTGGPAEGLAMFSLAELCAARGDRYLAWHAYQRCRDLGTPWDVDLPYYQDQLSRLVAARARGDFSELAHYRLRRRAAAWQAGWQREEAARLAAGEDPSDPAVWARYLEEHPAP